MLWLSGDDFLTESANLTEPAPAASLTLWFSHPINLSLWPKSEEITNNQFQSKQLFYKDYFFKVKRETSVNYEYEKMFIANVRRIIIFITIINYDNSNK